MLGLLWAYVELPWAYAYMLTNIVLIGHHWAMLSLYWADVGSIFILGLAKSGDLAVQRNVEEHSILKPRSPLIALYLV